MRALLIAVSVTALCSPAGADPAPASAPTSAAPAPAAPASEAAAASAAPAEAPPTWAPRPAPAAPVSAPGGRLTAAQLDAVGPPADSPCHAQNVEPDAKAGACTIVGPFPGEIADGKPGEKTQGHAAALAACAADPACLGISSNWYIGGEWYPVTGGNFTQRPDSYGCTVLLRCP